MRDHPIVDGIICSIVSQYPRMGKMENAVIAHACVFENFRARDMLNIPMMKTIANTATVLNAISDGCKSVKSDVIDTHTWDNG